jgi:catechol-2,3-dioxygenase
LDRDVPTGKKEMTPMQKPPFDVQDLGEVAIHCRDLAAMTAFYRDIVGLEVIEGDYRPGIVFLRVAPGFEGHTQVIALFAAEEGEAPQTGGGSSLHHLAFAVRHADLAKAEAWYKMHGLETTTAHHAWVDWDSVYVPDPEGNTVELVAWGGRRTGTQERGKKP